VQRAPVLVTAGPVAELRPSASVGELEERERDPSVLQPAVSQLVLRGMMESKQPLEAE